MAKQLLISEELTHSTCRIEGVTADGRVKTGSGFFYHFGMTDTRYIPAIITNKHVVKGIATGFFHITGASEDDGPAQGRHHRFEVPNFEQAWIPHPDDSVDICILPIGGLIEAQSRIGNRLYYRALSNQLLLTQDEADDLGAIEDVVMVGYPNGIWDSVNNMPVARRGITATHPCLDYDGKQEFLIDMACYPGSSGSPVFHYVTGLRLTRGGGASFEGFRLRLLGLLYAGPQYTAEGEIRIVNVPTENKPISLSNLPLNLGLIIKASRLLDFEPILNRLEGRAVD